MWGMLAGPPASARRDYGKICIPASLARGGGIDLERGRA
jgi:hypothetical protein